MKSRGLTAALQGRENDDVWKSREGRIFGTKRRDKGSRKDRKEDETSGGRSKLQSIEFGKSMNRDRKRN